MGKHPRRERSINTSTRWDNFEMAYAYFTQHAQWLSFFINLAQMPIVNQEECIDAYKSFKAITPRMICSGQKEGGKDSCQGMIWLCIKKPKIVSIEFKLDMLFLFAGDSGGPLFVMSTKNKSPLLVGVRLLNNFCIFTNCEYINLIPFSLLSLLSLRRSQVGDMAALRRTIQVGKLSIIHSNAQRLNSFFSFLYQRCLRSRFGWTQMDFGKNRNLMPTHHIASRMIRINFIR